MRTIGLALTRLSWLGLCLMGSACSSLFAGPPPTVNKSPSLLVSHPHQFSFAGRRSGEGYFSKDARQLIFQSEREPNNPFFQIYQIDLQSGVQTRLSTGRGKSTGGFFHPSGTRALFSATHLDPEALQKQEAEFTARAEGRDRRYAWDYDPEYEIFSVSLGDPTTAEPIRLTNVQGYDAEASWSPNGRQIVFASNRHAYQENPPKGRHNEIRDPAHEIDLYVMDSSGRNVRRLTDSPGYDGRPFFSPDGSHIVWSRFSENGLTSEIFTMRSDGTDIRSLTQIGAMSWAPFYHPSGDYVIFATNKHGHANFELYLVDIEGRHDPVRVTNQPGFDGMPAFSPDGKSLIWTSGRTSQGRAQLFRAQWNDTLARQRLGLPGRAQRITPGLLPLPAQTDRAISQADIRAHVESLASETTEGRLTGTPGEKIATSYVARVFRSIGLLPAGEGGTYFQNFGFTAGVSLGEDNQLVQKSTLSGDRLTRSFEVDVDWRPFAFSSEGEIPESEVVFAGYGIVAPESNAQRAIDSYAGIDVKGRWVLVFRYVPEELNAESRQHLHRYSSLRYKAMVARDRGARGLLVVSGPNSQVRNQLSPLRFDVSLSGSGIAALSITDAVAEEILKPSDQSLQQLQDEADADSGSRGFLVPNRRLEAQVTLKRLRQTGRNVLGRLQVGPQPSQETVMVGAHVDHLGRGRVSGSLAGSDEKDAIHPGADDNASGVAAMIEVAQFLSSRLQEGELGAKRDIVFAAWSGEELGLLGSNHWVKEKAGAQGGGHSAHGSHGAHASIGKEVIAYLNFDMVGRLEEDPLSVFGVASSPIWPRMIEQENVAVGLAIDPQEDSYLPTDATAFYTRGVPILAAFTGAHSEYHTPRDTPETLDYAGTEQVAQFMAGVARELAAREATPEYVAVAPDPREGGSPGAIRVYLGTIPDYAQSDAPGVLLSGVAPEGPADLAGLQGGDLIVSVAGRPIENIYDYTYALDALKVGESVKIVVIRNGQKVTFDLTPGSRE